MLKENRLKIKTTLKGLFLGLISITLVINVFMMLGCVWLYMIGFHNIDLGQNMRHINAEHELALMDESSLGNILSGTYALTLGYSQQNAAIFGLIYSTFSFTLCFTYLIFNLNDDEIRQKQQTPDRLPGN